MGGGVEIYGGLRGAGESSSGEYGGKVIGRVCRGGRVGWVVGKL